MTELDTLVAALTLEGARPGAVRYIPADQYAAAEAQLRARLDAEDRPYLVGRHGGMLVCAVEVFPIPNGYAAFSASPEALDAIDAMVSGT